MDNLRYDLEDRLIKMEGGHFISDESLELHLIELKKTEDELERLIDLLRDIKVMASIDEDD